MLMECKTRVARVIALPLVRQSRVGTPSVLNPRIFTIWPSGLVSMEDSILFHGFEKF
jgi:hypothetical protein